MNRYLAWLLGIALGAAGAIGWHQVGVDDEPSEFNNNEMLWLRMVAGDNNPLDGPINPDASNIWSACLDGDYYSALLGPSFAEDQFIALSVAEDYENWCPGDKSTNWNPFDEEDS